MDSGVRNGLTFHVVAVMAIGVSPFGAAPTVASSSYQQVDVFGLPFGANAFDAVKDGRLIVLVGADVLIETAVDSREFDPAGVLPNADLPSFGAAFIRVSPDGARIAVGNNGGASFTNPRVGVFDINDLSGNWLVAGHYDAEWINDELLSLTAGDFGSPSVVTVLDTSSADPLNPVNVTIINNIGGASGGIAFDAGGNLYTGNGYQTTGPSGTGAVKAFTHAAWTAALNEGPPLDFEIDGVLIVDVLSASPLAIDGNGNLIVGGGDFSNITDYDFIAVVGASVVGDAVNVIGPADPQDPDEVQRLDPDPDNDFNFFGAIYDSTLRRLYVRDGGSSEVHVYVDVGPFASMVLEFAPAPGQFANHPNLNDPDRALGAPTGGGTSFPNNNSLVSLGGFGGSIVLGFAHTVIDNPLNPFGMDAIVFGNAYWVGDNPNRHWAECATIEIGADTNGNGIADDPWFLIPGSHISNPALQLTVQRWDDNVSDNQYPPVDQSWVPPGYAGVWETEGYALPENLFGASVVTNPITGNNAEGIYGYADYSPTLVLGDLDGDNAPDDATITPEQFYTTPDDPYVVGITARSGGGDAFDIAWAVDPLTGEPAGLTGFDFLRLTNAVQSVSPVFGEKSAEIDAVADVTPDPFGDADDDGDIDLKDMAFLQNCFGGDSGSPPACRRLDREPDLSIEASDAAAFIERMMGPS